jgi:lipopolysaccharide transport system permease protein
MGLIDAVVNMAVGVGRWRTSCKLALQDIELRYKRSVLGPFWISASLVATILALAYVFADVFRQDYLSYVSFLAAGLLTWHLIVALANEGCQSVTEHSEFLRNVPLPITVIAGRVVLRNAIVFAHNLIAVLAILLIFGAPFSTTTLMAVPGALLILVGGYFMTMILGPICARFRDIPLVVQSAMQVLFFLTPIFWMPSQVAHRPMFTQANPFYHLIELVRAPLLGEPATVLNWHVSLWFCAGAAVLALITVSLTLKRQVLWL